MKDYLTFSDIDIPIVETYFLAKFLVKLIYTFVLAPF